MRVQELLPAALAGAHQILGRGKGLNKSPRTRAQPVIKRLQGGRIIFAQGRAELVDQRRPLGDKLHLITTQQPQFLRGRIIRLEGSPAVAIRAQGIGEA